MNLPDGYQQNSHLFKGCGPSILNCFIKKPKFKKSDSTNVKISDPTEETHVTINSISSIDNRRHNSLYIQTKVGGPRLYYSSTQNSVNIPETAHHVYQNEDNINRKLSPATLCAMLTAELEHYIKVEEEFGQIAEIQGNVVAAQHEKKVAHEMIDDENDDQEMEELAKLDQEIETLERILAQKMYLVKQKQLSLTGSENGNENYYYDYYSEDDDKKKEK